MVEKAVARTTIFSQRVNRPCASVSNSTLASSSNPAEILLVAVCENIYVSIGSSDRIRMRDDQLFNC
jgi:hypothetical protein